MRILFICNSSEWGGAEKYVLCVAEELAQRGHHCVVGARPASALFEHIDAGAGATAFPIDLGPKLSRRSKLDFAFRARRYRDRLRTALRECVRVHDVQLVHLQFKKEQLLGTALARRLGLRVIWTEHGLLPGPLVKFAPALDWYRRAATGADKIVCVSDAVRVNLTAHGINAQGLTVCRNGIDPGSPPDRSKRAPVRAWFGLPPDAAVVGTVCRLVGDKGIGYLIDAAPAIVSRAPSVRFLIVGDGPEQSELETRATDLGVASRFVFTGYRGDVEDILSALDVFAMPSLQEGLPYSTLEAMAAGLPVVASRVGGLGEVVVAGETGELVAPGDAAALGAAISDLLTDTGKRSSYAVASRDRVVREFSLDRMLDSTESVFGAATSEQESGRPPLRRGEGRLSPAFAKLLSGGLAGKALGIVRELALAASFGTGTSAGAFRAAQTATLIPTHFFSSDTLNAGFIPLYARMSRECPERANALFWSVCLAMGGIGVAIAFVLYAGAHLWSRLLVPGFAPDAQTLTAGMMRAMAIGVPFYVQGALCSYVEMARGDYLIGSLRSSIQNVGLLIGIIAAFMMRQPLLLGWGFTTYAVLFAVAGWHNLARKGFLAPPSGLNVTDARRAAREFAIVVRPLLLLPVVHQASLATERIVASLIRPDVVASLDYARTISETGVVLLAVPLGLAGLAELSRVDGAAVRAKLERLVPVLLVFMVPVSAFMGLYSATIVQVVFVRGEFGVTAAATTSAILSGLALGFWAHVAGYVLTKVLSARGRNREAVTNVAIAAGLSIAINIGAYRALGPSTLGIATSASGIVLLGLNARSLGLVSVIGRHARPLLGGVACYVILAHLMPGVTGVAAPAPSGLVGFLATAQGGSPVTDGNGIVSLAWASVAFTGFWLCWVVLSPVLRGVAGQPAQALLRRWSP